MIQPFFPEPIQVTRSVSQSNYDARIDFVKRTMVCFTGTLLPVVLISNFIPAVIEAKMAAYLLLFVLIFLTLTRRFFGRGVVEKANSIFGTGAVLCLIAILLVWANRTGWPVFLLASQLLMMLVYTLACGRDFSFVGFIVITSATQIAINLMASAFHVLPDPHLGQMSLFAVAFSWYVSYDLAMIMKRRRPEEVASSVADIYRDLLNFATYPIRVIDHWRKYRFNLTH